MTPREKNIAKIEFIAQGYGYTAHDILGKSKLKSLIEARRECVVMLRGCGYSTTEIGRIMQRDHSTICHALQKSRAKA